MAIINFLTTTPKIKTDIHSHLLPFLDDGVDSYEESISILKALKEFGYERFVITPHVMFHKYNNSKHDILKIFEELKNRVLKESMDIELHVAAEYYLDEHFMELIEKEKLLTFSDNYLLFELSFSASPLFLNDAIFVMQSKGYKPVLAHPERYVYMHNPVDKYIDLKNKGVLFQVNINSFDGYYSKPVKQMVERLFKVGYVDFVGSDAHGERHIEALKKSYESSYFKKYFKKNNILNDKIKL